MSRDEHDRHAWAKLNAYGFVLAGLGMLALTGLTHPAGTELARLAGDIPPGQSYWTMGFVAGGVLLLLGFLRTDRLAETAGLCVLTLAVVAQTIVAWRLLGWTDFTLTRLAIVGIIGGCTWARISVLWSSEGLAVTIPPRGATQRRRR